MNAASFATVITIWHYLVPAIFWGGSIFLVLSALLVSPTSRLVMHTYAYRACVLMAGLVVLSISFLYVWGERKTAESSRPNRAATEASALVNLIFQYWQIEERLPEQDGARLLATLLLPGDKTYGYGRDVRFTLGPNGDILDPWGTPYIVKKADIDHLSVRSAGPDRTLETADDIVEGSDS